MYFYISKEKFLGKEAYRFYFITKRGYTICRSNKNVLYGIDDGNIRGLQACDFFSFEKLIKNSFYWTDLGYTKLSSNVNWGEVAKHKNFFIDRAYYVFSLVDKEISEDLVLIEKKIKIQTLKKKYNKFPCEVVKFPEHEELIKNSKATIAISSFWGEFGETFLVFANESYDSINHVKRILKDSHFIFLEDISSIHPTEYSDNL